MIGTVKLQGLTMWFRTSSALLLLLLSACATTEPSPTREVAWTQKRANLERAAQLPWTDEGRCVVRWASEPWEVVAHQCYPALDRARVRFRDPDHRCAVASADAAAMAMPTMVGACLLAEPLVVGAVVVVGIVVVGVVIWEALEHERKADAEASSRKAKPVPQAMPAKPQGAPSPEPKSSPLGPTFTPPSPDPTERDDCTPRPLRPQKGSWPPHNKCADNVPLNSFPGFDVLVNGKAFDALTLATRTLWEIKTDDFDSYSPFLKKVTIEKAVRELKRERELARACGFGFRIGVRSAAHKAALERAARDLEGLIVVMDWC